MHGAFLIFFAESNTFKKTIRSKASLLGHTPYFGAENTIFDTFTTL